MERECLQQPTENFRCLARAAILRACDMEVIFKTYTSVLCFSFCNDYFLVRPAQTLSALLRALFVPSESVSGIKLKSNRGKFFIYSLFAVCTEFYLDPHPSPASAQVLSHVGYELCRKGRLAVDLHCSMSRLINGAPTCCHESTQDGGNRACDTRYMHACEHTFLRGRIGLRRRLRDRGFGPAPRPCASFMCDLIRQHASKA